MLLPFYEEREERKMADKRYYWLRLKEDFFADIRMRRLRKISAGGKWRK